MSASTSTCLAVGSACTPTPSMQAGSRHLAVIRPARFSRTSVIGDRSGSFWPQPRAATRPVTVQVAAEYPQPRRSRIRVAVAKSGCLGESSGPHHRAGGQVNHGQHVANRAQLQRRACHAGSASSSVAQMTGYRPAAARSHVCRSERGCTCVHLQDTAQPYTGASRPAPSVSVIRAAPGRRAPDPRASPRSRIRVRRGRHAARQGEHDER
jgi:hypothetical protein